jgi:predicted secreted hydrolase
VTQVARASRARAPLLLLFLLTALARAAPSEVSAPLEVPGPLDILRGTGAPGFALALSPRAFSFPQDHAAHPDFQHEWWYFTGHLRGPQGERFGFELTFFRLGLEPPAVTPPAATPSAPALASPAEHSRWRAREIYAAHFAITDLPRRRFHASVRYARAAIGLAGAQDHPWQVWLGGWSAGAEADTPRWQLHAADADCALTLQLTPLGPPVLNGERGLSIKADEPGSASFFYSMPRIAARGRLDVAGRELEVNGLAWLDREWGSGGLGPRQQGWDWFALQLADGSTLMLYQLRDRDGAPDPHSGGTLVEADGRVRILGADDVRIEVQDHWVSARGTRYPARWRLRSTRLGLDLLLAPRLADQELDSAPPYWEGAVEVTGTRAAQPLSGEGYVELVGYAR